METRRVRTVINLAQLCVGNSKNTKEMICERVCIAPKVGD